MQKHIPTGCVFCFRSISLKSKKLFAYNSKGLAALIPGGMSKLQIQKTFRLAKQFFCFTLRFQKQELLTLQVKQKSHSIEWPFAFTVIPLGFEPRTPTLKV
jgi:hypothetical protein